MIKFGGNQKFYVDLWLQGSVPLTPHTAHRSTILLLRMLNNTTILENSLAAEHTPTRWFSHSTLANQMSDRKTGERGVGGGRVKEKAITKVKILIILASWVYA